MIPAFPYTRKGYRKNYLKKRKFIYDVFNDINEKGLISTKRIDKNGYIVYKAVEQDCSSCPFKEQCTKK